MIPTHISKLPSVGVWLSMFFVLTFQRNNGMNPGKHWDVFSKTPRLFPGEGEGAGRITYGRNVLLYILYGADVALFVIAVLQEEVS